MPEPSSVRVRQKPVTDADWSVYLVRCADGTLYTGITTDVRRRVREHEYSHKGAKFLRGRGPLNLAFEYRVGSRSVASRIEYRIKRLPLREKQDAAILSRRIDEMLLTLQ